MKIFVKIGEIKMMNADCILHAALEDDKEMVRKELFSKMAIRETKRETQKDGWVRH
jgi:hypothetical protein